MDFHLHYFTYFLTMAIIFCPECGIQISEHAMQCIKCSYPIYKLKANNYQANISTNQYSQLSPPDNFKSEAISGLIISGYVVAFLSFIILPIYLLLVGIVLGIITISKGSVVHGIAHIVLSIVLGTIGAIIGTLTYLFY